MDSYLGLNGSEQFSEEGSESQILIRWQIAQCLWNYQSLVTSDQFALYVEFARHLDPTDIIVTFNYDTLLESALDRIDKPYKLVPNIFQHVDRGGGIVDNTRKEVTILKMHGSIDWFDKSKYNEELEEHQTNSVNHPLPWGNRAIFDDDSGYETIPVIDGPYIDSSLTQMHRVRNIEKLYRQPFQWDIRPSLLLPSVSKVLYSRKFSDFWWSFNSMGEGRSQIILIGYSLPSQDEYAFQAMFTTIKSFLNSSLQPDMFPSLPIVAFIKENKKQALESFKSRLSFIPQDRLRIDNAGFGPGWLERLTEASASTTS